MHSFQPSRGRVFLEVLLALGMSASLAGAWMQTHATALLGAAGIAALYGLIHLFDMRRPRLEAVSEPQRIEFAPETPEACDIVVPMVAAEPELVAEHVVEEAAAAEPEAPRSGSGRRSGGARKGSGRRAKAPKEEKVADLAVVEEEVVPSTVWPMAEEEEAAAEPAQTVEDEFGFLPEDDASRSHIEPLFEPDPFARMPRRAFGRRGRL